MRDKLRCGPANRLPVKNPADVRGPFIDYGSDLGAHRRFRFAYCELRALQHGQIRAGCGLLLAITL